MDLGFAILIMKKQQLGDTSALACRGTNKMATTKRGKAKIGRRKIEMTDAMYKQVCALCAIQCTAEEIASVLDISVDTLERRIYEREGIRFADFFKIKRKAGFASLRRMQWEKAKSNDSTMLIWLGKQYLGQKDVPDAPQDHDKPEIYMRPARLAESDEN